MTIHSNHEPETWRPVVGFEGLYEVSDLGRVRSVDRQVWRDGAQYSKPHQVPKPGRIKSSHIQKLGYVGVMLWKDGKVNNLRVHRLVLEAFVGPAPEGMETLHGNGVRHDNRLTNLKWGTWEENYADRVRHGTAPGSAGSCKRGHLLAAPNLRDLTQLSSGPRLRRLRPSSRQLALDGQEQAGAWPGPRNLDSGALRPALRADLRISLTCNNTPIPG